MSKVLLISVKPEFAEKIFNGTKQIELRKCTPNVSTGDKVIVYSTVPEKAVLGTCIVKAVIKESPAKLWRIHSSKLGIDRKRYFEYYKNQELAIGIVLTSIEKFAHKITLDLIKKHYPKFSPPQTFKYFSQWQFEQAYKKVQ
jgi:predicted transcriptional regulator